MFLTMKLGTFVRLLVAVALVVVVVFMALANVESVPRTPVPNEPVPTERAAS